MRTMTVHKSRSFQEADDWDVAQQLAMTPEERRAIARELKRRFYGEACPDVRESGVVRLMHPRPRQGGDGGSG